MLLSTARSGLAELQPKKSTSESGLKIELTSTPSSGRVAVGLMEGLSVGVSEGDLVGSGVGDDEGNLVGESDGDSVGMTVGA